MVAPNAQATATAAAAAASKIRAPTISKKSEFEGWAWTCETLIHLIADDDGASPEAFKELLDATDGPQIPHDQLTATQRVQVAALDAGAASAVKHEALQLCSGGSKPCRTFLDIYRKLKAEWGAACSELDKGDLFAEVCSTKYSIATDGDFSTWIQDKCSKVVKLHEYYPTQETRTNATLHIFRHNLDPSMSDLMRELRMKKDLCWEGEGSALSKVKDFIKSGAGARGPEVQTQPAALLSHAQTPDNSSDNFHCPAAQESSDSSAFLAQVGAAYLAGLQKGSGKSGKGKGRDNGGKNNHRNNNNNAGGGGFHQQQNSYNHNNNNNNYQQGGSSSSSSLVCQFCGRAGHDARHCWDIKNKMKTKQPQNNGGGKKGGGGGRSNNNQGYNNNNGGGKYGGAPY